jgi:dolichol-phosphate mannosyltransferase
MINERRLLIIVDAFKRVMTIEDEKKKSKFSLFVAQTIKYFLVGGIGVGVNLGLLYGLTDFLGMWYILSQGIAIAISITNNFFLHRYWTFKNEIVEPKTLERYIKFFIVSIIGMGIQLGLTFILVENYAMYYLSAAVLSIIVASAFNYLVNRKWTFEIKL